MNLNLTPEHYALASTIGITVGVACNSGVGAGAIALGVCFAVVALVKIITYIGA